MARPNKRIRQARAKACRIAENKAQSRHALAASIPNVRSNVSSWDRTPQFGGVGYTSGHDKASFGMRDLEIIAGKRTDYCDPSLVAYNKLSSDMKKAVDSRKARL